MNTKNREYLSTILEKYIEMEEKSELPTKYYVHNEFDANNVTDFEGFSNDFLIVLKSKLPPKQITTVMYFFQNIYDCNNYAFEWWLGQVIHGNDDGFKMDLPAIEVFEKLVAYSEEEHDLGLNYVDENYMFDERPGREKSDNYGSSSEEESDEESDDEESDEDETLGEYVERIAAKKEQKKMAKKEKKKGQMKKERIPNYHSQRMYELKDILIMCKKSKPDWPLDVY
jgi:hypothetical protein